jgi:hypothetical protein
MPSPDSALDTGQINRIRSLLASTKHRERLWPVIAAAAFLAISALAFATAMIMAPPLISEHVAAERGASQRE